MADATSVPALDRALARFEEENPSFEACPPEDSDDWEDLFAGSLEMLRECPDDSAGLCTQVTFELVESLRAQGLDIVSSEEMDSSQPGHPFSGFTAHTPDSFGYQDRPYDSPFPYHAAGVIRDGEDLYLVDYTAGQYGYEEFPLVQKWAGAKWARTW